MSTGRTVLNVGSFCLGAHPFINFMKVATDQQCSGDTLFPTRLNSDGYPSSTLTADILQQVRLPTSYSGDWIIDWSGQIATGGSSGIYILDNGGTPATITTVSGTGFRVGPTPSTNLFLTGTNGSIRVSFSTPPVAINVYLQSSGAFSSFSNLRIYRADQATLLGNGEIFNPDFLNAITALNPKVLRFLDWENTNGTNVSRYSYLPPDNAMIWGSYFWPPGVRPATMTTGGTSTAYTCGNGTDHNASAYVDGETIQLRIHTTNTTTTPTLNRGSLGAKTIVAAQCYALGVNDLATNGLVTLMYSAQLGQFMAWTTGATPLGVQSGVPLSIQVALCNKLNMDGWFLFPTYFDDTSVSSFTTYIKNNLNAGLSYWSELSNEIWNPLFIQTSYAAAYGDAAGLSGLGNSRDLHYFYGLRFRQMMGVVATAWSGRTTNELKRVIAGQSGNTSNLDTYRLQGSDLGAFGYSTVGNRPVDFCDVLSYATYYQGPELFAFAASYINAGAIPNLKIAADNYNTGSTATALAWVDNAVRTGAQGTESLLDLSTNIYPAWETLRATYSKIIAIYEGGYQVLAPDAATCAAIGATGYATKINTLLEAYKNNSLFYTLVTDQINQLQSATANAIPAWYYFILGPSGGQWSLYPGELNTTPYQSYNAIAAFNAQTMVFLNLRLRLHS